jgi:DNA polymerase (family 10)
MINQKIADIFSEMAILLDMQDVQFKPRAYEKTAMEIAGYNEDIKDIYNKNGLKGLDNIPTVGKGMAKKIEEYIKTGKIKEYEQLKKKMPVNISELSAVEGVGPKMIKTLYKKLKIKDLKDLERVAMAGKIKKLPGMGEKTEKNILEGVGFVKQSGGRQIFAYVLPLAEEIRERLKKLDCVTGAVVCGSLRRKQETVGDIDIVVSTGEAQKVNEFFVKMPEVVKVYKQGNEGASVRLNNGLDVDILSVPANFFGGAVLHFTGNKAHNVALRKIAIAKKMKLNERGLFKGKKLVEGKTEKAIYKKLGLKFIPPELRTDSGEIEMAKKNKLSKILPYGSVKGDLQIQTNWSDGVASIEDMALAAIALGHKYIAITDHTKSLAMTGGLDEKRLLKQGKEIDKLNKKFARKKFRILKSSEVDILKDGSLDIKDEVLKNLDLVSIAVHTNMKMGRKQMTARIIKAMSNPYVNILFHPTGRLINRRPEYDVDIKQVIEAAKKYNVALEINAYPDRLDLRDQYVKMAVDAGVKMVIDSDAHSPDHLKFIEFGEAVARRGWAKKKDILNTKNTKQLLKIFNKKH